MGEVLGLGVTHGPYVINPEETMANFMQRRLKAPSLPLEIKDRANWPAELREEYGDDEGLSAAHVHRTRLVEGFRAARKTLDEFNPDLVLIWGDDQHENFLEDIVPAFCVYAQEEFVSHPFRSAPVPNNIWGNDETFELRVPGAKKAAKELAASLLGDGFDIAWAYKQLHHEMAHAFWRTVVHLDYDRTGFAYPIIPLHVNCYGRRFSGGGSGAEFEFDPPSPTPTRCFDLGASVARFFKDSPYRVALIGSSSWSHGFLTEKNHFLWPDVPSDRERFAELSRGDYEAWKRIPLSQIEDAGQHEMLNWMCLAGAAAELGLKPKHLDFVETWVFNSCKVFAVLA
jgi:hypothetical protein